jgi:glycerol-3-phosphate acyltransferase PlsY
MSDSPALNALLHNWFYGNFYIRELCAIGFAFLFASIPITPTFHWLFDDLDPRVARTATALAPVVNAGKGFIAAGISAHGGGLGLGLIAAVAAMLGHCYCPWRRFDGGAGATVLAGVLAAVCWPAALIYCSMGVVIAVASNYLLVGALGAAGFAFVSLWFFTGAQGALAGVAMLVIVASRRRAAFVRLGDDREPSLRRAPRGAQQRVHAPVRSSVVALDGHSIQRI